VDGIARDAIKEDILAMSVTQPVVSPTSSLAQRSTYPSTCPIIDITARVLE
jgi:hypothetical protein